MTEFEKEQERYLRRNMRNGTKCLHNSCTKCNGKGVDERGNICIHMISCPCPRCNLTFS